MKFLSNKQPGLDVRAALSRKGRLPVMCAISYIGVNAFEYLPLKKGDTLVCDAEPITIKQGSTDPESLEAFHRRGVKVYSRRGLHAKVIAGSRTAWIGSANASGSSSKKIEASIRTTDPSIVKEVHEFITELTGFPGYKLTQKRLDELLALERRKGFVQGSSVEPEKLPDFLSRLKLAYFEKAKTSDNEDALAESTRGLALSERSKLGAKTSLEDIYSDGETKLRKGDWVVLFNGEIVMSPAFVLSIHRKRKNSVCWLARPQVQGGNFSQLDLEAYIGKKLPPRAMEHTLSASDANKVLDFFRE